ncbi:hypothetical protein ACS0TY_008954 [Phlomoides rotata]
MPPSFTSEYNFLFLLRLNDKSRFYGWGFSISDIDQVEFPKEQPKFQAPFLGFTRTAEIWNSRACMIGLIGTFIVELILNKGILELIGAEIGKGLDIPL